MNPWDIAKKLKLYRGDELIDPGVNFFIAMLDQMGAETLFSCGGHPLDWYVVFHAPYEMAYDITRVGFIGVSITMAERGSDMWRLDFDHLDAEAYREGWTRRKYSAQKTIILRYAATAWEKAFGPLDWDAIILEK